MSKQVGQRIFDIMGYLLMAWLIAFIYCEVANQDFLYWIVDNCIPVFDMSDWGG